MRFSFDHDNYNNFLSETREERKKEKAPNENEALEGKSQETNE